MAFAEKVAKILAEHVGLAEQAIIDLLEQPPDASLGDIAFPCFVLAKQQKKSPHEVARAIATQVTLIDEVVSVKAVGAYLNFFADKENMAKQILITIYEQGKQYGVVKSTRKRIAVEFFSANTHKAVHIGHVRNIATGECLSRIFEAAGHKVIRLNYPADVGPHVAKCLWNFLRKKKIEIPTERRGAWLATLYVEANKLMKTDEKAVEGAKMLLQKLYAGDKELNQLWLQTRQWCLDEFERVYKDFNVKFERTFFESEMEIPARKLAQELLEKKIAEKSDGAVILNLEKQNLGVFVILTSDGRVLYSSKDMALALTKFKDFQLDESFYLVGKEQEHHFEQVFASLALMGEKKISEQSHHISYDLVTLKDGARMSSREGNVITYDELFDALFATAKKEVTSRHPEWPALQSNEVAGKLVFSSLKFQMINRDMNKKIAFSIEEALDFEGETGAYILYAYARLCSLFRKYGKTISLPVVFDALGTEEEQAIIRLLADYPAVVEQAALQARPMLLSRFTLQLAQQFNKFYHAIPVLQADESLKQQRLILCKAVQQVLENATQLLDMDFVEEM